MAKSWIEGDLNSLLIECRLIQSHLPSRSPTAPTSGQVAHHLTNLMIRGKLRAASCLIEDNADSFPLSLDATVTISGQDTSVKEVLLKKHPPSQPPKPSTIVEPSISSPLFHPGVCMRSSFVVPFYVWMMLLVLLA